jgi:hypothetical protein
LLFDQNFVTTGFSLVSSVIFLSIMARIITVQRTRL